MSRSVRGIENSLDIKVVSLLSSSFIESDTLHEIFAAGESEARRRYRRCFLLVL